MISGLVSVVVGSYNYSRYLDQRLESLFNQTYDNLEIIVIDDCSTDDSVEVLAKYESHPKVTVVRRERNGGVVRVMNQGIEIASGEFIIFAQCDDLCDPRQIGRLVDAMNAHPSAGIASSRSLLVDDTDAVIKDDYVIQERSFRRRCQTDTLIAGVEMNRFLLYACVMPNMSAVLLRRETLEDVGYFSPEYSVCCDWDLFFRIAHGYDFAYIAEPLNRFRQHEGTIRSTTKERIMYEEHFRLLGGQIRALELSALERCRYRTRLMYLWSLHLISPSYSGLRNLAYHLGKIVKYDSTALLFFVPAVVLRTVQVMGKLVLGRERQYKAVRS